ncbi:hypothetical protein B0H14DRAFT_2768446, partial [Mycena olivaceomarginata]
MRQLKLAVASTPAQRLILGADWSTETYTKYFTNLFPDAFCYIESQLYRGDASASLCTCLGKGIQMGLKCLCAASDRGSASKIAIPSTRYTNWDLELELESPEAEGIPVNLAKGKGKARARSISPVIKLEKVGAETSEEDTSDMKKAAKMRTRLDTQSIKRKVFRMPDNSDDERPVIFEVDDSDEEVTFPKPATLFSKVVNQSPLFSSFLSPDGDVISPFPSQPSSPTAANSSSASSSA